jgi:sugar/nucleoside kinase (ribokinase family)
MRIRKIEGVLCAGNISHDILARPVDRLEWGTSTWVPDLLEDMGGNGSNTSYTAAMLGAPAKLLGMVGRDRQGDALLEKLAKAGVDLSEVGRSDAPTTTTICAVHSNGERLFIQRIGSSADAFRAPIEFRPDITRGVSHFHLANIFALPNIGPRAPETMRQAREAGLTTSLDTGWDTTGKWMQTVGPCLPDVDLLFVNREEARMLTGQSDPADAAELLRRRGAHNIVIKLGGEGCVIFTKDESLRVAAFPVEVVDTTGAGDCFAGAFLAMLQRGMNYGEAARTANAVGAMVVEKLGAVTGVRGWEDTTAWIGRHDQGAPGSEEVA